MLGGYIYIPSLRLGENFSDEYSRLAENVINFNKPVYINFTTDDGTTICGFFPVVKTIDNYVMITAEEITVVVTSSGFIVNPV